jgi:hypothetical protein
MQVGYLLLIDMKLAAAFALVCLLAFAPPCSGQSLPTIPANEQRFFAPDNGVSAGDEFGGAIAADGQWAVAGARFDDSALITDEGSAYVLKWTADVPVGSWKVHQKLTMPMTAQERDRQTGGKISFGQRVALSGEWMAISAPRFKTASGQLGRIVVYKRSGDTWAVAQIIEPENSYSGYAGAAMVISNDRLAFANNHGTVHVYSRSTGETQPPWFFQTTIDAPTTSGETGLCLALRDGNLLIGIPGMEFSHGQSKSGHIREYGIGQFQVTLLTTIPSPALPQPNELKHFASSIAVSGDWLLVSSSGLSGSNAKVFSYRRQVAANRLVTWELVNDTSILETGSSSAPAVLMNENHAVVTTVGRQSSVFRLGVTSASGPAFASLQKVGVFFTHGTRLQEYDLYQSAAVAGDTVLVANSSVSETSELFSIPHQFRGHDPQRVSPPQSYLMEQDAMGRTVAASGNLLAVSAPLWRPSRSFSGPTPQRGAVHLYRRLHGLWEYSDSVNNTVDGPTSPAFGQLLCVNSGWLAMNGREGVYAYRLLDGQAEILPSFTIRSKTNPNATLLNLEFDSLNESTLIVAWKNGNSGTLIERFSMPTEQNKEPTFQSVLTQTGVSDSVPLAIEKGLAALAHGSEISVYDTAINPWKRMSRFSPEGGAVMPGASTDGLFFNAGQILAKTSAGLRGYEEKSGKWALRWLGHPGVVSAKKDALLGFGSGFVSITRPNFDQQNTFPPISQTLSLVPAFGRDQPRSPTSGVLTEDSAIVGCSGSAAGPLGMVWMRYLEDLKLYDGPTESKDHELLSGIKLPLGTLAPSRATDIRMTLKNSGHLTLKLDQSDLTISASERGTTAEIKDWSRPQLLSPGQSLTFKLSIIPVASNVEQTLEIAVRKPTANVVLLTTGYRFSAASEEPTVASTEKIESPTLLALGSPFAAYADSSLSRSLEFQWLKDGRALKNQTESALYLSSVLPKDAGTYQLRVKDKSGQSGIAGTYPLGIYDDTVGVIRKRWDEAFTVTVKTWGKGIRIRWGDGQDNALNTGSRTSTLRVSRASITPVPEANLSLGSATAPPLRWTLELIPETYLGVAVPGPLVVGQEVGEFVAYLYTTPQYQVPDATFTVSGLPPGLKLDSATGQITGTPTRAGDYSLILNARSADAPPPPFKVSIIVRSAEDSDLVRPGAFAGLVDAFVPGDVNKPLPGLMRLQMSYSRRFSGLWLLGSRRLHFAGIVGDEGAASVTFRNYSGAEDLVCQFFFYHRDFISVAVSSETNSFSNHGDLNLIPPVGLDEERLLGRYSAIIETSPTPGSAGLDSISGCGFMSFTIGAGHAVTSVGTLPDGTGFTGSGAIMGDSIPPDILNFAFTSTGDSIAGRSSLNQDLTVGPQSTIQWQRAPRLYGRLYSQGFSKEVYIVGAKHFAPAPGMLLFGGIDQSTATLFSLEHPSLFPEPIQSPFRLTTRHTALFPAPNLNRLKMNFYAPTGFFTGSFTTTDMLTNDKPFTRHANFRGMVIPGINRGGGFFLMPALPDPVNEPSVSSSQTPIYSGKVSLGIIP